MTPTLDHVPWDVLVVFAVVVVSSVFLDLVLHRRSSTISVGDAALWSTFWVALSLGFAGYLAWRIDVHAASLFLSGWALEKSLSVDNLMVFMAIFRSFWIPSGAQHRILYLGIIGAMVFRLFFVAIGGTAQHLFGSWVDLAFAGFVGWAAWKMLRGGDDDEDETADYERLWLGRVFKRVVPVVPKLDGSSMFVSRDRAVALMGAEAGSLGHASARRFMTPAFVCLLAIEWSDVMFSFDSVPVVLAVSRTPIIVYSAMIFAVLGLRSLYFLLEALSEKLAYLEQGVGLLLVYITGKLILHALNGLAGWPGWEPSHLQSLAVVAGALAYGIGRSVLFPPTAKAADRDDSSTASPP
jgi:tellurite resistance protein TerC